MMRLRTGPVHGRAEWLRADVLSVVRRPATRRRRSTVGVSQASPASTSPLQITRLATITGFAIDAQGQSDDERQCEFDATRPGNRSGRVYTRRPAADPTARSSFRTSRRASTSLRANAFRMVQPGANPGPPEVLRRGRHRQRRRHLRRQARADGASRRHRPRRCSTTPRRRQSVKARRCSESTAQPLGDDRFDGPGNFGQSADARRFHASN